VTVADVRTETQAVTWYAGEHEAIAASVGMAVRAGLDAYAWQLSCALTSTFWHAGARWLGGSDVYETAMEAARRVGGAWALGLAHRSRALYRLSQQRIDDAEDDLTESLRLFEEVGDRDLLADVHLRLGWVSGRRDDHSDQRDHAETALRLFRATGNRIGTANSYNDLASCLVHFDDHEQAVILCKQALAILEEIEYRMCEAATWSTLGLAHVRLGLHDEAIRCYERANELHRKVDGKLHQADTHTRIGEIHLARGATGEARQAWQQAVALFEELRLPDHADTLCARLAHLD
jgi:tetratricopeptide (TPR) repeat protein